MSAFFILSRKEAFLYTYWTATTIRTCLASKYIATTTFSNVADVPIVVAPRDSNDKDKSDSLPIGSPSKRKHVPIMNADKNFKSPLMEFFENGMALPPWSRE